MFLNVTMSVRYFKKIIDGYNKLENCLLPNLTMVDLVELPIQSSGGLSGQVYLPFTIQQNNSDKSSISFFYIGNSAYSHLNGCVVTQSSHSAPSFFSPVLAGTPEHHADLKSVVEESNNIITISSTRRIVIYSDLLPISGQYPLEPVTDFIYLDSPRPQFHETVMMHEINFDDLASTSFLAGKEEQFDQIFADHAFGVFKIFSSDLMNYMQVPKCGFLATALIQEARLFLQENMTQKSQAVRADISLLVFGANPDLFSKASLLGEYCSTPDLTSLKIQSWSFFARHIAHLGVFMTASNQFLEEILEQLDDVLEVNPGKNVDAPASADVLLKMKRNLGHYNSLQHTFTQLSMSLHEDVYQYYQSQFHPTFAS